MNFVLIFWIVVGLSTAVILPLAVIGLDLLNRYLDRTLLVEIGLAFRVAFGLTEVLLNASMVFCILLYESDSNEPKNLNQTCENKLKDLEDLILKFRFHSFPLTFGVKSFF